MGWPALSEGCTAGVKLNGSPANSASALLTDGLASLQGKARQGKATPLQRARCATMSVAGSTVATRGAMDGDGRQR
jgi:hypothetical protein